MYKMYGNQAYGNSIFITVCWTSYSLNLLASNNKVSTCPVQIFSIAFEHVCERRLHSGACPAGYNIQQHTCKIVYFFLFLALDCWVGYCRVLWKCCPLTKGLLAFQYPCIKHHVHRIFKGTDDNEISFNCLLL